MRIQTSGIQCEWERCPDGTIEIAKLEINGKPFDEKGTYTGAASDFFVGEAKHYLGIEDPSTPVYLQQTVFETLEKKVRDEKRSIQRQRIGSKKIRNETSTKYTKDTKKAGL